MIRVLNHAAIIAALASLLSGCASTSAQPGPLPSPAPTPLVCKGKFVGVGPGAQATLTIYVSWPGTKNATIARTTGKLRIVPSVISLSLQHPRAVVDVYEPRYRGGFVFGVTSCAGFVPSIAWSPSPQGPRTTAIFSL